MSLLTFASFKTITGLSGLVDESRKYTPFATQAERELKKMFGETLYGEVESAIASNFAGGDAIYSPLWDLAKTPLAWRTLQHALPRMYSEPTANGIHMVGDANYTPVDSRTLAMQVAQARDYADAGYDEMLRYLRDNSDVFTSYDTIVDSEERVRKTYKGGVITRKSRYQYPYGLKNPYPYEDGRNQYGECCE